jgi:hypothetical protein
MAAAPQRGEADAQRRFPGQNQTPFGGWIEAGIAAAPRGAELDKASPFA